MLENREFFWRAFQTQLNESRVLDNIARDFGFEPERALLDCDFGLPCGEYNREYSRPGSKDEPEQRLFIRKYPPGFSICVNSVPFDEKYAFYSEGWAELGQVRKILRGHFY